MIGFLLYFLTAAITLFCYELLKMMGSFASGRPPAATYATNAGPACVLLVVAGIVHLWRPRVAGVIALIGTLLIWSVLLSPMQISTFLYFLAFLQVGYVLPVLVVATLTGLTTVYAGLAAFGVSRFSGPLSPLLTGQLVHGASVRDSQQAPITIRVAAAVLYIWFAIYAGVLIQSQWNSTGRALLSIWIFDITLLAALLWVIIQSTHGRKWARIVLLVFSLLTVPGVATAWLHGAANRTLLAFATVYVTVFAAAVLLLFSRSSVEYFSSPEK